MICPRCERGRIKKIGFKHIEAKAYICDFCDSMWYENERISSASGRLFSSVSGKEDSYSVEEFDKEDQEHQPAEYVHFK